MSGAPDSNFNNSSLSLIALVVAAAFTRAAAAASDVANERAISLFGELVRDGGPFVIVCVVLFGGGLAGCIVFYKCVVKPERARGDARAEADAKAQAERAECEAKSQAQLINALESCAESQRSAAKYSAMAARAANESIKHMKSLIHHDRNKEEARVGRSGG